MVSNAKMAEFRDVLREILDPYIQGDIQEELVINIVSAARMAFSATETEPRRGTAEAMCAGLNRIQLIKTMLYERFRMNYPWDTKHGQDMLEFLSTRPDGETIAAFADWWWSDLWRRDRKGAPSLTEIYINWPQAFGKPNFGGTKVEVYRAEEDK